ncbi:MAG: polysaccharide deacetylase family protein [Acidobacteriia bacterium]|nr:polysaccharide deacetylase family protein [Terriglobia bacterium]
MMGQLIGAVAAAAAASAAGYQSMAPTGQWYGATFTSLPRGSKQLALTYDDGPNDPHTLRLMEVLAKHEVRATFFLIGRYVEQRPDIVRELVKAGHVVGNHTFTHPLLIFQPAAEIRTQLENCERALTGAVGEHSNLFRPPFGGRRPAVMRIVRERGLVPVMWNVTGYDWSAPSVEHIERKVTSQVRGGDVILLHDGGHLVFGADRSSTVVATDRLIARYKAEGCQFVTIPEMMQKDVSHQLSAVS